MLCFEDDEVVELARVGQELERHRRGPQDIEFAFDSELRNGSGLVLLQCRPETVWSQRRRPHEFDSSGGAAAWVGRRLSEFDTDPIGGLSQNK